MLVAIKINPIQTKITVLLSLNITKLCFASGHAMSNPIKFASIIDGRISLNNCSLVFIVNVKSFSSTISKINASPSVIGIPNNSSGSKLLMIALLFALSAFNSLRKLVVLRARSHAYPVVVTP